jgi:hypothetical protein
VTIHSITAELPSVLVLADLTSIREILNTPATIDSSPGLSGEITSTAPAGASDIVRIVGYQIDGAADIIYFNPSNDWVEI